MGGAGNGPSHCSRADTEYKIHTWKGIPSKGQKKVARVQENMQWAQRSGLWIYTERKLVLNKHVMTGVC